MPSTTVKGNKLFDIACPVDEQMRRYPQTIQVTETRVFVAIEFTGKQSRWCACTELAFRQRHAMHDDGVTLKNVEVFLVFAAKPVAMLTGPPPSIGQAMCRVDIHVMIPVKQPYLSVAQSQGKCVETDHLCNEHLGAPHNVETSTCILICTFTRLTGKA